MNTPANQNVNAQTISCPPKTALGFSVATLLIINAAAVSYEPPAALTERPVPEFRANWNIPKALVRSTPDRELPTVDYPEYCDGIYYHRMYGGIQYHGYGRIYYHQRYGGVHYRGYGQVDYRGYGEIYYHPYYRRKYYHDYYRRNYYGADCDP